MDLASPRYEDDPTLALRQMSFMAGDDEGFDPEAAQKRVVEQRWRAHEVLMRRSGWLRRIMLRRIHLIIELFAGTRDTPKYQNRLFHQAVRKRALIEGRRLVGEGRLDSPEDIFDLTFRDPTKAAKDTSLDLREIREQRTRFLKVLKAQVKHFPGVIDFRGRILRPPPRKEQRGELRGIGLSPGVAIGPVKMLHDPHEKSVDKGDVLVAYTTVDAAVRERRRGGARTRRGSAAWRGRRPRVWKAMRGGHRPRDDQASRRPAGRSRRNCGGDPRSVIAGEESW